MKTNLIFSLVTALPLLVFTGCSADNEDATPDTGAAKVTLTAGYATNYAVSRTGLDRDYKMIWHVGDVINVNGVTSTQTTISEAGRMASFVTATTATYYAFYPASMVNAYDAAAHTFSVTLPAEQIYRNTVSFSDNVNPAVAVGENTYLGFYHVCGMLKVPANTNVAATKARFLSMDKPVSGAATVNPTDKTLTVTGTGMTVDITSLSSLQTDTLTWVLPVGTYCKGWRIQFLDNSNNVLTETVSPVDLVINRGEINVVGPEIRPRAGIYCGGVYWAKGNLGALTTSAYTFSSTQELSGDGTSSSGFYFCWNTLNSQATASSNATAAWITSTDPCAKVAPLGAWRTPTRAELTDLLNSGSVWGTKNGIAGRYFDTTVLPAPGAEDSFVFLPATGSRVGSSASMNNNVGTSGYYWSATPNGTTSANSMIFDSTNISININGARNNGLTVRCVSGQ